MEAPLIAFYDETDFDNELTSYQSFTYPHIGEEVRITAVNKAADGMYLVTNVRFVLEGEEPTPLILVILSRQS